MRKENIIEDTIEEFLNSTGDIISGDNLDFPGFKEISVSSNTLPGGTTDKFVTSTSQGPSRGLYGSGRLREGDFFSEKDSDDNFFNDSEYLKKRKINILYDSLSEESKENLINNFIKKLKNGK